MTVIIKGHLPQVTDMASLLSTGEINRLNKIVEWFLFFKEVLSDLVIGMLVYFIYYFHPGN